MLDEGNSEVFIHGVIMDTAQAKQILANLEAKRADIIKVDTSTKELYDMFMDMVMLEESQGEMTDRIEYHVEHAVDYVQTTTPDTKRSLQYQAKARRKKICCCCCCGSIVVLIIVIVIIVLASTNYFS